MIVSVAPGQTVRQALRLMSLHDVSQLPVMDGTTCVGSVSDWSLSAKSLENPEGARPDRERRDGRAVPGGRCRRTRWTRS